jgi:hypothetical protein
VIPPGTHILVVGSKRSEREGIHDLIGQTGLVVATRDWLAMPYLVRLEQGLLLWFRHGEVALVSQPKLPGF